MERSEHRETLNKIVETFQKQYKVTDVLFENKRNVGNIRISDDLRIEFIDGGKTRVVVLSASSVMHYN